MSKFNTKTSTKTVNVAGGESFKESTKLEFVSLLLTSFVKDQFYRSEKGGIKQLKSLISTIKDKKFVAKASIYARTQFGMRSVSHIVAGEIAKEVKGENWTKNYFKKIVYRPDDATEILSYYINNYKKPIPNSLKKGLGMAISSFDEYKLAKYKADGKALSMIDLVNLVRPKSSKAIDKLMKGELKSFDTWETNLSNAGKKAKNDEEKKELKKEVWEKLIREKKIGYFALLRNLRNIIEQSPDVLDEALVLLTDENLIKKSLVLPFRYLTAIEEIKSLSNSKARSVLIALNKAIDIATSNVPKFDGETLVVLDTSGSMSGKPAEIGALFSAILVKNNNADFIVFSDNAEYVNLNPADSTLTLANSIEFIQGGTNFHSIFRRANKAYDRIVILSDMQGWVGYDCPTATYNAYKKKYNCNPKVFSFNLQDYGTLQFPEPEVYCLAGFSEKTFDIMKLLEQDKNALINEIEKIEL